MKENSWHSQYYNVSFPETADRNPDPFRTTFEGRSDQDSAIYLVPNPTAYGKKYNLGYF